MKFAESTSDVGTVLRNVFGDETFVMLLAKSRPSPVAHWQLVSRGRVVSLEGWISIGFLF